MSGLNIIFASSCFMLNLFSECKDEEGEKKEWAILKIGLPAPCYIPRLPIPMIHDIIFALEVGVCLVIMLIPFPMIFFLHKFITIGLGVTLFVMHIVGTIFGNGSITQMIGIAVGAVCAITGMSEKGSKVPLLCIGTYMGGYLIMGFMGFTSLIAFCICFAIAFGACFLVIAVFDRFFLVIIKTMLCLMSSMIICEILSPINLIGTIHGKAKFLEFIFTWINRAVIVIGGILFALYNYYLAFVFR